MSGFNNRPPSAGRQSLVNRVVDNVASSALSGIISTKPTARYSSGARCILKINGKLCGFAFGISWRIQTQATEIQTIDNVFPHELAPQRIVVDGTISALHIPGQGVGIQLWQPDMLNFLFQQYISLEVRDVNSNDLLFKSDKVMIVSRQEDIKVDQLSSVQLSWRAIGFQDERTPEIPNDHDKSTTEASGQQGALSRVVNGVRGLI